MPLAVILAALLAVTIWGASAVATKIVVAHVSPILVAVLRTVLGGAAALPLALALRVPFPPTVGQRAVLVLSAVCGFIGFPFLFSFGQQRTSAIHGALILAVLPVFTGAYAMAWDRRWPASAWWLGCILAVAGEGLLVSTRQALGGGPADLLGDALILTSALFASLGYVAGGRLQQAGYASAGTTFWGVTVAAVALLPVLGWIAPGTPWREITPVAWAGIAYIAIGVTIVGYLLWYWALGHGGIARIGLFQFLQPISGVLLAALLLGETLSLGLVLSAALILSGVMIAQRAK